MRNTEEQGRQNQVLPEAEASTSIQRRAESQVPANQETSSLSLLKLPNEVLCGITGYLDLPERMLLALTCKFLMSLASPERSLPRLDPPDKRRFLLALQRDIPKTFLCPWCSKLQRLNPEVNWTSQGHYIRTICSFSAYLPNSMWRNRHFEPQRHIIFPNDWQAFMSHGYIRFMDAHLIMNRHFYGPLRGISLRHLTRCASFETELELDRCLHGLLPTIETRWRAKPNAESAEEPTFDWIPVEQPRRNAVWRFSLRYSPKIIDDKLYLARSFTFAGPNVPWDHLARLMNSIKPKVCNHMSCIIVMHPVSPMYFQTIPCGRAEEFDFEFSPAIKSNWKACGFNPGMGSCLICKTDYDVSLTQNFLEEEWRFSCNTYHCLGPCRVITDPLWDWFVFTEGDRDRLLPFPFSPYTEVRAFTDDGNELVFGHSSTNGEARRKWLENTTEAEIL
ncbi:hypothetical protein TRIATDRAFT_270114 [Trichoderma atroviride IMI 206040]|uniref:F-box domain-containing protein n=1 Tax=Hypocrea atroviridis (strain ATCC 20476 / IMI 206040) TaxID=452589 RepID=G9NGC6_HYPAI|nr:uncharacterized protein TRIATDRAFT_270114 [Trichoderma atroviride IMI 206040]EHK50338.1 hypothetical protein TRIATDRAFT_270114 [Trichoderma atroviride IMI 206040]